MEIILICFTLVVFYVCIIIITHNNNDYEEYVHKMAESTPMKRIDELINEEQNIIDSKIFKGEMLKNTIKYKKFWEQVKLYKTQHNNKLDGSRM